MNKSADIEFRGRILQLDVGLDRIQPRDHHGVHAIDAPLYEVGARRNDRG